MTIWILFLGSYSDRRAVAAFDNEKAAITAAEALWQMEQSSGHAEGVDLQRFPLQTIGLGATLDGGADIWADGRRYE